MVPSLRWLAFAPWLLAAAFSALTASAALSGAIHSTTLDEVRARGHVVCGINDGPPGFAAVDGAGAWAGLDIDFCRAVAAAVLGRKDAVKYRALSAANRFQALAAGEVDLIPRAASWTLSRDVELGLRYAGTLFFDGQGFIVRRGYAVASVLELSGASVCVLQGTSAEENLADFFRSRQMRYQLVVADHWQDIVKAYADGGCTLLTGDLSVLAYERSRFTTPADHMILPELIGKEPSGPVVRQGDEQWFSIVRWTLNALIAAEEMGLTSENADNKLETAKAKNVRRFLGLEGNLGVGMGLNGNWSFRILKEIGNYGEIFDRNLGVGSPLALDRGVNGLWTKGGLMYAFPLR
ncbi:MAG: amino acid ABC transporter substrate-binding protein [Hyphomicrobium sp.]|jgi:general L-amino acid transport system substrate-binding protein